MKKIIVVYGLITGSIIIGVMILMQNLTSGADSAAFSEWFGYLVMIIALSAIFVAIKRYRDQELGGVIKFGTAFLLGLGISIVASTVYVIVWEVNLSVTDYAFVNDYAENVIADKEAAGATDAELLTLAADMEKFKSDYKKPLFRVPMTFLEIFPVALLVTLLSAAVLRNSRFLPAT